MILAVKSWAKEEDVNDASVCTMSSYVLSLLVINYLQCGVCGYRGLGKDSAAPPPPPPPVLPSLQQLYPTVFRAKGANIFTLPYLNKLPEYKSENKMSLGIMNCSTRLASIILSRNIVFLQASSSAISSRT